MRRSQSGQVAQLRADSAYLDAGVVICWTMGRSSLVVEAVAKAGAAGLGLGRVGAAAADARLANGGRLLDAGNGGAVDICCYVVWFGVISFFGWLYECIFCAIKNKRWDNRGFLFGPVCPIYGFGFTTVLALFLNVQTMLGSTALGSTVGSAAGADLQWWQVFIASALGSAVLEYATSYVLERWFHARWWDYSGMPLNVHGRICLPFTLCFGAAGVAVYYLLCQHLVDVATDVPQVWWEVGSLVVVGLMSADAALSVSAMSDLTKRIEDAQADFDAVMEVAVNDIATGRVPLRHDVEEHARRMAGSLTGIQRRALTSMRSFSTESRSKAAALLRRGLSWPGQGK